MFGKKSESKKGKTSRPKQAEQLFKACESGRTNDVHKLLQISGTSYHINVFNDNGLTPLHLAAESATSASDANMFNYLSICKMLLDAGADPNIGSQAPQNTILHYLAKILIPPSNASLKIFLETLLTYALSKGGDSNKTNREGLSPLHEAAIKGNVDVIGFFLNLGGNPNSKSSHGETPLHFAVVSSNEDAVKLLLSKGADPDAAAERGTPREISKKLRLNKIEQLLAAVPPKTGGSSGGSKTLGSSGSIGSSSSSIGKPPANMAPPPDLPPPPPPGAPDEQGGERASYALDEGALNDLITKISEPEVQPERSVERQSKPLPAPPNKNKTPSMTPAPAPVQQPPPETRPSGKDGHGELNDLLDELDFGENDDPVLPGNIEEEYDENDMPDIKFQLDPITSQMCVRAATLDKLVERLSIDRDPASGFRSTLLLTYRSYVGGVDLLKKLVARFKKCGFESTQLRILGVLKTWLEMHFYDFQEDDNLRVVLFDFLDRDVKNPNHRSLAGEIKNTYRDQKDFAFTSNLSVGLGGGVAYASPLQFLAMDEAEVARQLTLIESEIYCAIKPKEILDGAWNKKGKEETAPHIIALIQHFNNVSRWVVTEILNQSSPKQRAAMIEKIIYLGTELRELSNFNGAMEVLAALNSPAVTRLKKTWELVGEDQQARLEAIQKLMSHNGSYKEYRLVLRDVDPPCLPYLGMYLSDITFIQDGEPNVVENNLINFAKHHKVAQVIGEIQFFQESGHSGKNPAFPSVAGVVEWWRAQLGNLYSEKEAYQVSLKVEPDQEGQVVDTGAMAQLKQENESLQIRVSQLEQLNREQADEISVLTEKLKAAQREVRVAKDVADMLRAAQAAKTGAPAPALVANISFEPPAAKPLPTFNKPTPQPVRAPSPPPDIPPDAPPPIPDMAPPDLLPPEMPPVVKPTPVVTRTNDRLQELREKYRARQGTPAASATPAAAAEAAKPAAPAAANAKGKPAATTAVSVTVKKAAPKAAAAAAPAEVAESPPAAGSTAAALREKFKLNKGAAASTPALAAVKSDEPRNSGPGRASSGGEEPAEGAAPTEGGASSGGGADALLASMTALREKYKKPAAKSGSGISASPPAAAPATKPPAAKPTAPAATPPAKSPAATGAGTPKASPRPKPQPIPVQAAATEEPAAQEPPASPKPKGRPLPKMALAAEPKIIMMKPMAPRPKPAPPPEEEPPAEAEPEQQWDE